MEEKIHQWEAKLDDLTRQYREVIEGVEVERLNWQPNANAWSIAQITEHVILTNASYFIHLEKLRQGTYPMPWLAKFPWLVQWLGNLILHSVQPTTKRKAQTLSMWRPSQVFSSEELFEAFEKHQKELILHMKGSEGLLEQKAVIRSPANKNIVYSLENAFEILIAHEDRHLQQAIEVKKVLLQKLH